MVSFNFQRRKLQDEESKAGADRPLERVRERACPPSGTRIIAPLLDEPCSAHAVERNHSRHLEWCKDSEERIRVNAGSERDRCAFMIHKALLRHYSDYFRGTVRTDVFRESESPEVDFPEVDPVAFGRFVGWLYSCRACKKGREYEPNHKCRGLAAGEDSGGGHHQHHDHATDSPWCGPELEHDYVLGDWLLSRKYCTFVLSHFITHVDDSFSLDRVRWILENTTEDSPIQRFVRHWVCWLKLRWLDGTSPLDWARYPDLSALDCGWAATDPRKYSLDHWESPCVPAANSLCSHRVVKEPMHFVSADMPSRVVQGLSAIPRRRLWEKFRDSLKASLGILVLVYHFFFPFAWVAIAAYIVAEDNDPLLFEASKFYSLVVGCCAIIGIWPICMRMMKLYFAISFSLLVLMASVLSFASSSTCLAGADNSVEVGICKMEIGVGVLQFIYAIIVASSYKW